MSAAIDHDYWKTTEDKDDGTFEDYDNETYFRNNQENFKGVIDLLKDKKNESIIYS